MFGPEIGWRMGARSYTVRSIPGVMRHDRFGGASMNTVGSGRAGEGASRRAVTGGFARTRQPPAVDARRSLLWHWGG